MGRRRTNPDRRCTVVGCDRVHSARGYCDLHWQRWRNNLPMDAPPRYHQLNKKGWVMKGYRWISTADRGEILEHRYVMEKHLGRELHTDEVVHHINGNRLDNRPCNLEIMERAEHTSHHRTHKRPCIICSDDTTRGSHGLCGKHGMRARSWSKHFGIDPPESKIARAFFYLAIATALENNEISGYMLDFEIIGKH